MRSMLKKLFPGIIFCMILGCQGICQTYTYHKFPTSDDKPVWGHLTYWYGKCVSKDIIGMVGDTMINGYKYSKVYYLKDTIPDIKNIDTYFGAIREDSNKRVYLYQSCDSCYSEKLIFDFSKVKGDSVLFNNFYHVGFGYYEHINTMRVVNTHYQTYNNTTYRILFMESIEPFEADGRWIEGIGNENMLFSPAYSTFDCMCEEFISCFRKNDSNIIGGTDCFYRTLHATINEEDHLPVRIFPNPVSNELKIELGNNVSLNLLIYNTVGNLILKRNYHNSANLNLDVSLFTPGLYFIYLSDTEGKNFIGKFFKL